MVDARTIEERLKELRNFGIELKDPPKYVENFARQTYLKFEDGTEFSSDRGRIYRLNKPGYDAMKKVLKSLGINKNGIDILTDLHFIRPNDETIRKFCFHYPSKSFVALYKK